MQDFEFRRGKPEILGWCTVPSCCIVAIGFLKRMALIGVREAVAPLAFICKFYKIYQKCIIFMKNIANHQIFYIAFKKVPLCFRNLRNRKSRSRSKNPPKYAKVIQYNC